MKKEKSKKNFWDGLKFVFLEVFGELLAVLILFAAGAGILYLLGGTEILRTWEPEVIALVGSVAISVLVGIVIAVVKAVKKKKR